MDDHSSASTDPKSVLKALRSLAVTLDDYEEGANEPAGLDVEAISRRKDALGSLAAMLSQAISSGSDASSKFDLPITEWSCCQTASIATRITKLADPTSEQLVCRPTCTSGARMLWWIANDLYDIPLSNHFSTCMMRVAVTCQSLCCCAVDSTASSPSHAGLGS